MSDNAITTESPDRSKTDQAKEQGRHVGEQARSEAGAVAEKARSEVGAVAEEAQEQVRGLLSDAQDRVQQEAQQQVDRLAAALNGLGENLKALREGRTDEAGPLAGYLERAQDEIERFGSRVEELGLSLILDETRRFARRRPGLFLGSAALAGLVVGRLGRGGRDAQQADGSGSDAMRRLPAETGGASPNTGAGEPASGSFGTVPTSGAGASGTVPTQGTGASATVPTPSTGSSGPGENDLGVRPVDQYGTVRGGVESER